MSDSIRAAKVLKLWDDLRKLRSQVANLRPTEIYRFAEAVGRTVTPGGKHMRLVKRGSYPITVPTHGALNKITAGKILDALEADLIRLEETES